MKVHRFYHPKELTKQFITTNELLIKQLIGVLRIQSGEHIRLFNEYTEKEYEIVIVSKKLITGYFIQDHPVLIPHKKIILAVAITKKDTFELIGQKITELGITTLVPIISERTIKKDISIERLQKIIIEATEQSGRNTPTELSPVTTLTSFLEQYPQTIIFDTVGEKPSPLPDNIQSCLIGPEGGWTEKERMLFNKKQINSYSLGNTVLRTETAAIVAAYTLLWQ